MGILGHLITMQIVLSSLKAVVDGLYGILPAILHIAVHYTARTNAIFDDLPTSSAEQNNSTKRGQRAEQIANATPQPVPVRPASKLPDFNPIYESFVLDPGIIRARVQKHVRFPTKFCLQVSHPGTAYLQH
ncbi:hypothetical protein AJ78_05024 [Emergomyces pasteurianus Ep9510]|uniref:Uncharacterized protein n=1 Tax=Emergomyces pasteurianus Ep9510 TaxID=1447872 RepID=A0A1J9PDH3_9EURO|nr:hypothetical protein AJ78_05024 [Emergomyces pasteurianus Ep9510]